MPKLRTWRIAAIIAVVILVVSSAVVWHGLSTGWAHRDSAVDFCDGRAAKTFDRFWQSVGSRELDADEGYSIAVAHRRQPGRLLVWLNMCLETEPGVFQCKVESAKSVANLKPGDAYRFNREDLINWFYRKGPKRHYGCNIQARLTLPFGRSVCEKAARDKFHDFRWLVRTADVGPTDHWVDVQVAGFGQRAEMRLNRCKPQLDGRTPCRIDSAPPEHGLNNGDEYLVRSEDVIAWSVRRGDHVYRSCDGADLTTARQLDKVWNEQAGKILTNKQQ